MKRRTFIGGLLATFGLIGTSLKASEKKSVVLSEEEEFFQFFLNFNGFPINDAQKSMYRFYKNGYTSNCYSRQVGVTTFMLTLAAWEAFRGKKVVHFSSNMMLSDHVRRMYDKNINERFDGKSPPIDFVNINRNTYPLKGLRYDIALLDQSDPYYHKEWSFIMPLVDKHLLLKTYEL